MNMRNIMYKITRKVPLSSKLKNTTTITKPVIDTSDPNVGIYNTHFKLDRKEAMDFSKFIDSIYRHHRLPLLNSCEAFSRTEHEMDTSPIYLGFEWENCYKGPSAGREEVNYSGIPYSNGDGKVSFYTKSTSFLASSYNETFKKLILPYINYINFGAGGSPFELVSTPATVEYHKQRTKAFFNEEVIKEMTGPSSCGLHIHISKSAFSAESLLKMLCFFDNKKPNSKVLDVLSNNRFTKSSWCSGILIRDETLQKYFDVDKRGVRTLKESFDKEKVLEALFDTNLYPKGIDTPHGYPVLTIYTGKSVPANNRNFGTIEIRIFNSFDGTNPNYLYQSLEFCDALTRFCRVYGFDKMTMEHFVPYVLRCSRRYPELINFLNKQGFTDGKNYKGE